jgi:hypothetical protein
MTASDWQEGLKTTACVNLCNVFTVRQSELKTFVGTFRLHLGSGETFSRNYAFYC